MARKPHTTKIEGSWIFGLPPELSALEKFARWFHQDWKLLFADFDEAAREYFLTLSAAETAILRSELTAFLSENPGRKGRGLRNAWRRLGAGAHPHRDLSGWLRRCLEQLG